MKLITINSVQLCCSETNSVFCVTNLTYDRRKKFCHTPRRKTKRGGRGSQFHFLPKKCGLVQCSIRLYQAIAVFCKEIRQYCLKKPDDSMYHIISGARHGADIPDLEFGADIPDLELGAFRGQTRSRHTRFRTQSFRRPDTEQTYQT